MRQEEEETVHLRPFPCLRPLRTLPSRFRQELLRRHSPEGVTSGLYQGLTGFGLSVLGAVAGVADQPLQGLFAVASGEENLSKMQMLSQVCD